MNYGIQRLAHLVQIKNDLNRKRRRFYHIANPRYPWKSRPTFHILSMEYAKDMYEKAKLEMKAMTAEMRACRKEINASLIWSSHGAISFVKYNDQLYSMKEVARFAELYKADAILLGD